MSEPSIETTEVPWYRGPAFQLMVVLVTVYAVSTFIGDDGWGGHFMRVLLILSLLLGVKKLTPGTKAQTIAVIIVVVGIGGDLFAQKFLEKDVSIWSIWLNLVFFAAVLVFLILAVLKADRVNSDTVFASAAVFMLMGIVWAQAFMLVHAADPEAFSLTPRDLAQPGSALLHFSFTTLTTVGYGSISPMSDMARMLSDLEALIAQLYLAVVVARLVSLEIEHSRANGSGQPEG